MVCGGDGDVSSGTIHGKPALVQSSPEGGSAPVQSLSDGYSAPVQSLSYGCSAPVQPHSYLSNVLNINESTFKTKNTGKNSPVTGAAGLKKRLKIRKRKILLLLKAQVMH